MLPYDWFTSDTHYGHAKVIGYSDRPFTSVEHMEHVLVGNYNALVHPMDRVLFVGDFALSTAEETARVLGLLNGHKTLVLGNHDRSPARMAALGFEQVVTSLTMAYRGIVVRAAHKPYRGMDTREVERDKEDAAKEGKLPVFDRRGKDEALIHGHTHSTVRVAGQAIHVGVDAWNYRPAKRVELEWMLDEMIDGKRQREPHP
jgi:calcineurin-like phosphoesterase family protein